MATKATIRVLLVDDECLVRQVLGGMLAAYSDMEVVGDAARRRSYLERRNIAPHIVVMDAHA